MCDCISYNRPSLGGTVPEVVLRYNVEPLIPAEERRTICVDACIAEQIQALWTHGFETGGCCCGHNNGYPDVGLLNAEDVLGAAQILRKIDSRVWRVWAYTQAV